MGLYPKIPWVKVETLTADTNWDGAPPPVIEEEEILLTPERRMAYVQSLLVFIFLIAAFFPFVPLYPLLMEWSGFQLWWQKSLLGLALLVTGCALYRILFYFRASWASKKLFNTLRQNLQQRGRMVEDFPQGWMTVSPVPGLRIYSGLSAYDFGFFRFEGDWVHFIGDLSQFSLHRSDVKMIQKGIQLELFKPWHLVVRTELGEQWLQINLGSFSSNRIERLRTHQMLLEWATQNSVSDKDQRGPIFLGDYQAPTVFGSSVRNRGSLRQSFLACLVLMGTAALIAFIFYFLENKISFSKAIPGLVLMGLGSAWVFFKACLVNDASKEFPQDQVMPQEQVKAAVRPEPLKVNQELLGVFTPPWQTVLPLTFSLMVMMFLLKLL